LEANDLEARIAELEAENHVHRIMLSAVLAEMAVASGPMRASLEDMMWQARENRPIHIPPEVGEIMPSVNRITLDLFELVNSQLSVPLKPKVLPQQP